MAALTTSVAAGCATSGAASPPATSTSSPGVSRSGSAAASLGSPGGTGAASPAAAGSAFTLVATGDLLIHKPVANRALADGGGRHYDFRRMLSRVKPLVAGANLAICHIETPLSANDKGISG